MKKITIVFALIICTIVAKAQMEPTLFERGLLNDKRTKVVEPDYSSFHLKADHTITVNIVIDELGNVVKTEAEGDDSYLRIVSSNKAKQTKFAPYLQNGKAIKTKGYLTFTFYKAKTN